MRAAAAVSHLAKIWGSLFSGDYLPPPTLFSLAYRRAAGNPPPPQYFRLFLNNTPSNAVSSPSYCVARFVAARIAHLKGRERE